jgi:hypothetical protein
MAWFKCDDTLAFNAKVLQAGNEAIGLWLRAGTWCASQMSDGVIPRHVVVALSTGEANAEALASRLLEAKLWDRFDESSNSYIFHDWLDYQPSASEARERRKKRAEAGRKGGLKSGLTRRNGIEANASANAEANAEANGKQNRTPSRPVPSFIPPTPQGGSSEPRGTRIADSYRPSDKTRAVLASEVPDMDLDFETEQFVNWWAAKPGKAALKTDWDRTWLNWMRKAGKSGKYQRKQSTLNLILTK